METLVSLGVPYTEEEIARAKDWMNEQSEKVVSNLYSDPDFVKTYEADMKYAKDNGEDFIEMKNREIVAVIAYLQRLGTDIKVNNTEDSSAKN